MENSVLVQVNERLKDLVQKALGLLFRQWLISMLLHVFFEVELQVLEHQEQLVLRVDNLLEPNTRQMKSIRSISTDIKVASFLLVQEPTISVG